MFGFGALKLLTNKWLWIGIVAVALSVGAVFAVNTYNTAIAEREQYKQSFEIANKETKEANLKLSNMVNMYNARIKQEKELNVKLEKYRREQNVYQSKIKILTKRLSDPSDTTAINDFNNSVWSQLERIQGHKFDSAEIEAITTTSTNGSICLSSDNAEALVTDLKKIGDSYEIIYSDGESN